MTVAPENASVLTVEYKMNLVAPADGEKLVARGQVVKAGRTLVISRAEVFAVKDGKEILCALMQQTIMVVQGKSEK
jgi:acyl-coenzyme A thioesterase PaaI-like protein